MGLSLLAGCQSSPSVNELRGPAVSTRFTTNPLADTEFDRHFVPPAASNPSLRLGLNMQSGIDPVRTHFASNLGTVLMRELQLSNAAIAVEPLVSLQPQAAVPQFPPQSSESILAVAFTSPQDGLPPQLPPNPIDHSEALPSVDQILVVRVIEYRPYYPLRATLDVRVLDGQSQAPVFATTATWSGDEYESGGKKFSLKKAIFCREPACLPAPGHNSPQALIHEVAGDLAAWYNHASTTLLVSTGTPKKTWHKSWRNIFREENCKPAASLPTSSQSTSCLPATPTDLIPANNAPAVTPPPAIPDTPPVEMPPVPPAEASATGTATGTENPGNPIRPMHPANS